MGTLDETLVEYFSVQEVFCDGFTNYMLSGGVMSCVGYRLQPPSRMNGDPMKLIVARLAFPISALDEAIAEAKQAQAAPFNFNLVPRLGRH